MKTMSSGIQVFSIQKAAFCGGSKGKIIPRSFATERRYIIPRDCCSAVRATSTVKRWFPFAEWTVSGTTSSPD
jgi:hypothetical protein